ncbi:hypothetical protein ACLMJK_003693 [Lecanora helva]
MVISVTPINEPSSTLARAEIENSLLAFLNDVLTEGHIHDDMHFENKNYRNVVLDLRSVNERPAIERFELEQILQKILDLMEEFNPTGFVCEIFINDIIMARLSMELPWKQGIGLPNWAISVISVHDEKNAKIEYQMQTSLHYLERHLPSPDDAGARAEFDRIVYRSLMISAQPAGNNPKIHKSLLKFILGTVLQMWKQFGVVGTTSHVEYNDERFAYLSINYNQPDVQRH